MKDFYIADAAHFENQPITSFFCISAISARDRKGSGQYLALTLSDKSGQFEARMWDDFADALQTCPTGSYVKVQGQVSKYQGKFQITLTKLRLAAASEIDTSDFIPTTQYDIPSMAAELRSYVDAFSNPHLRALVFAFLDDPQVGAAFLEAPAAKRLHHAWIGGLLEHVLCLVRVCLATAPFYPEVDPDLLLTGAILHDIGKVRELSWRSSFDYTLEGQLIGHISIAMSMLNEKIALLNAAAQAISEGAPPMAQSHRDMGGVTNPEPSPDPSSPQPELSSFAAPPELSSFAAGGGSPSPVTDHSSPAPSFFATDRSPSPLPELSSFAAGGGSASPATQAQPSPSAQDFPPQLRLLIEHMLLSHHGKLEFGSPKLPMTPEAILLSALDDLEAKFQTLRNAFADAATAGRPATEPTEWVRSMDRALFNSQAYLNATPPKPAKD